MADPNDLLAASDRIINERSSKTYTFTLLDDDDTAIPLASISTLTLTLDTPDGTVINSRTSQDVKNANNVTVHATSGLVTWTMQPADNQIVSSDVTDRTQETHRATWVVTLSDGRSFTYRETFQIIALDNVPAA